MAPASLLLVRLAARPREDLDVARALPPDQFAYLDPAPFF